MQKSLIKYSSQIMIGLTLLFLLTFISRCNLKNELVYEKKQAQKNQQIFFESLGNIDSLFIKQKYDILTIEKMYDSPTTSTDELIKYLNESK